MCGGMPIWRAAPPCAFALGFMRSQTHGRVYGCVYGCNWVFQLGLRLVLRSSILIGGGGGG